MNSPHLSITTDSDARKRVPLLGGLFGYFAAALVGVAKHSYKSNEKHNKGQPLHWSIDKSNDHAECVERHLLDLHELLAARDRVHDYGEGIKLIESILSEADALAWRALALSQTLRMQLDGAPMPFNARRSTDVYASPMEGMRELLEEAGLPVAQHEVLGAPGSMRDVDTFAQKAGQRCDCGFIGKSTCDGDCVVGSR